MRYGKVWGSTETVFESPFAHIERINILPHSRCSEHDHKFRANGFHVFKGVLTIHVKKNTYGLTDATVLRAGQSTIVDPLEFHYFETGRDGCEAIEWYTPQPLDRHDIERRNVGARTKAKKS